MVLVLVQACRAVLSTVASAKVEVLTKADASVGLSSDLSSVVPLWRGKRAGSRSLKFWVLFGRLTPISEFSLSILRKSILINIMNCASVCKILVLLFCMILFGGSPEISQADQVLSVFDFPTTEAARLAWQPSPDSQPVALFPGIPGIETSGIEFPLLFTADAPRCYWDRNVSFDLSEEQVFSLRLFVSDPSFISGFSFYFHSPGGWYAASSSILKSGWQTMKWDKSQFSQEQNPLGWHQLDRIRFSPWKEKEGSANLIATELKAYSPSIIIVKPTKNPNTYYSDYTTNLIASILDSCSFEYGIISDEDAEGDGLRNARLAFLPYNTNMTDPELSSLEDFVTSGGKIISFYNLDTRIANLLAIQKTGWVKISLAGMRFVPGLVECAPEYARQASWNITLAQPGSPQTRIWAYWEDAEGNPLDHPSWLVSANGAFMTHILLNDDPEAKKRMILSLVAHFLPEVAENHAESLVKDIGKIGLYEGFEDAVSGIRSQAAQTPRKAITEDYLTSATLLYTQAQISLTSGTFCQMLDLSGKAKDNLLEAFYYSHKPRVPEFRAVWNHSGTGAFPGDWEKSAENLAQNGFNAVFPNMLWAGLAHYQSDILPHSDIFETYGDQISQCVSACHARNIQVHVWKVNWNLANAPQDFIDQMRSQNRTQVDISGDPVDWLCPSHPDNYLLELDTMLEVAAKYDVDGIHFDYIRYPDEESCYCAACRIRFQNDTVTTVTLWPDQCYSGALKNQYRQWRADQITRLVKGVSDAIKIQKPSVKVSAAVFSQYPSCKTSVGQDWLFWVEEGYLDFVCPMDYTDSPAIFRNLLQTQMNQVNGLIPLYPGVGVTASSNPVSPDQFLAQLQITRELGTGGFILFNYDRSLSDEFLLILHKGFTAIEPLSRLFIFR